MRSISRLIPLVALACAAPALAQELIPGGPAVGIDDRFVVARGLDSPPSFLEVLDDGTGEYLYAAGGFVTADGEEVNGLARWDDNRWEGVGDGSVFTRNGERATSIEAMAYFDDGDGLALYVGGFFDRVGEVEAKGVACWDGESWREVGGGFVLDTSNTPEPLSGTVVALSVFDNGSGEPHLVAAGRFTESDGERVNLIAQLTDGAWRPVEGENALRLTIENAKPTILASPRDMIVARDRNDDPMLVVGFDDGVEIVGDAERTGGVVVAWNGRRWRPLASPRPPLGVSGVQDFQTFSRGSQGELYAVGVIVSTETIPSINVTWTIESIVARWTGERWAAEVTRPLQAIGLRTIVRPGPDRPEFFIVVNGPTMNLRRSQPLTQAPDAPFQFAESLDVLADETPLPVRTRNGRRSQSELAFLPGSDPPAPVVALQTSVLAPDRAATAVVTLDGGVWRTLAAAEGEGFGANARVSQLLLHGNGDGAALHAAGEFSVLGSASGAFAAMFDEGGWLSLGRRVFIQDGGDSVGLFSISGAFGEQLIATAPTRPTEGGDQRGLLRWEGDRWTPQDLNGSAIERASGAAGDLGEGERVFAAVDVDGPPFQTFVEVDGATVSGLEFPYSPFTLDLRFRPFAVLGGGPDAALIVFTPVDDPVSGDRSPGAAWDGESWSPLPAGDPLAPVQVDTTAPFEIAGQPVIVTAGRAHSTPVSPLRYELRVFDGDTWAMLPGVDDSTDQRFGVVGRVQLRGRDWLLLHIAGVRVGSPQGYALHDGRELTPLDDILPVPDGAITDILSNPLPDGREEVILAGDFLTIGGTPSARIGRVILPALEDVNADGAVDGRDVAAVARAMRTNDSDFDLDFDGDVDRDDMAIVLERVRGSGRR